MTTFVDTSALYALLDRTDPVHGRALRGLARLRERDAALVTHAYVLVESMALIRRRLGWPALGRLLDDILPLIEIRWIGPEIHQEALATMRAAQSSVSFVDWVSFAVLRREGIREAFAFDDDFVGQGFVLID